MIGQCEHMYPGELNVSEYAILSFLFSCRSPNLADSLILMMSDSHPYDFEETVPAGVTTFCFSTVSALYMIPRDIVPNISTLARFLIPDFT